MLRFKNFNIITKLNLLLLLIFTIIVGISSFSLSTVLEKNVEQIFTQKASILIDTMSSVRRYTSEHVNPELSDRLETESYFISETVPAYSAKTVFKYLRSIEGYENFLYREATINPTNLRDKADGFEKKIIEKFREDLNLKEQKGYRSFVKGDVFYIARPLAVNSRRCLKCHGDPKDAPQNQINTYGRKHGFGWKLNEIVGAQIVSVPVARAFNIDRRTQFIAVIVISIFSILSILIIDLFLKQTIIKPLKQIAAWAKEVSTGNVTQDYKHKTNDEIGLLAAAINRLKVTLEMAINMLDSKSRSSE